MLILNPVGLLNKKLQCFSVVSSSLCLTIEDRSYGSGLKSKKSIESPIQSLKCPPPLNGIEQRKWGKEIR